MRRQFYMVLLTTIASIVMVGCDKDDKKDDPIPEKTKYSIPTKAEYNETENNVYVIVPDTKGLFSRKTEYKFSNGSVTEYTITTTYAYLSDADSAYAELAKSINKTKDFSLKDDDVTSATLIDVQQNENNVSEIFSTEGLSEQDAKNNCRIIAQEAGVENVPTDNNTTPDDNQGNESGGEEGGEKGTDNGDDSGNGNTGGDDNGNDAPATFIGSSYVYVELQENGVTIGQIGYKYDVYNNGNIITNYYKTLTYSSTEEAVIAYEEYRNNNKDGNETIKEVKLDNKTITIDYEFLENLTFEQAHSNCEEIATSSGICSIQHQNVYNSDGTVDDGGAEILDCFWD